MTAVATALAVALFGVLTLDSAATDAATVHAVPLPSGSRSQDGDANLYKSGQGFGKTVRFYKKFLERRGLLHDEIPVYEYRGTTVARFLSRQRGSEWSAIHVFKKRGLTMIYIVPNEADEPPLTSGDSQGKEATP